MIEKKDKLEVVEEKLTWWIKNRNKVYGTVLFLIGLVGGNVDRVNEFVSTNHPVPPTPDFSVVEDRIKLLEEAVEKLEYQLKPVVVEGKE